MKLKIHNSLLSCSSHLDYVLNESTIRRVPLSSDPITAYDLNIYSSVGSTVPFLRFCADHNSYDLLEQRGFGIEETVAKEDWMRGLDWSDLA